LISTVPGYDGRRLALAALGWQLAMLLVGVLTLAALLLVISGEPLIAFAVFALPPAAYVMYRWPAATVCLVALILYTNASAIAVRIHGVPFIAAAAYPMLLFYPIGRHLIFGSGKLVFTPALPYILAFLAVQILGVLFSMRPEYSMGGLTDFVLEGLLIYFLFTNAIRTPTVLKQVVWTLLAAATIMGALVAYQQFTESYDSNFLGFAQVDNGLGFDAGGPARQRRLGGPLGMPNRFAQIMAVLVPVALYQFRSARTRMGSAFALAALIMILLGAALTFSRGAAVGLAFLFMLMIAIGQVRIRHVALILVAIALVAALVPQYSARVSSILNVASLATKSGSPGMDAADGSTRGRITEMVAAVIIFTDHPIVGVGPKMYAQHYIDYARVAGGKIRANTRQAHNLFLDIAAEHGALGLGAFLMAVLVTMRQLMQARLRWLHSRPDMANLCMGFILALVAHLATGMFLHASYIRYFWFLMAIAAAAAHVVDDEQRLSPATLVRTRS
jgi:O-antigen ligase